MNKTTIIVTKHLRDLIKMQALINHMTMQRYIHQLVEKDTGIDKISS